MKYVAEFDVDSGQTGVLFSCAAIRTKNMKNHENYLLRSIQLDIYCSRISYLLCLLLVMFVIEIND